MSEAQTVGLSGRLETAVETARERFQAAWRSGNRPRIEEFLEATEESARNSLFRELLLAETQRRMDCGEGVSAEEYYSRFPDLTSVVDEVLDSTRRPVSPLPLSLPERFGRYRIVKTLGRGGMGAVYLAHDTQLDRRVALKVPHFDPDEGQEARDRFYREARVAATFDHPNLCPVYDVGQIDGVDYLTMPYLEGKPLSSVIDPGKPGVPRQVAAVIRKLALALDVAHGRGVVHRDLKPANIMACRSRELVIMDFGLARRDDGSDARITRSGVVMGTPAYMPPEQASGDQGAIGPRSDIYSLGVIMYELLSGRRPFEGSIARVLGLIMVADPPALSTLRPEIDSRIETICQKAMAKKPEDRYASMAEFAADLSEYLTRPTGSDFIESSPAGSPGQRGLLSGADTQVAAFFPSLVTEVDSGLALRPSRPESGIVKPPRWLAIAAAATAAALVFLGAIVYVVTDKGRLKIEVNDPNAVVNIDGDAIRIEGLGEPISVRAGEHNLIVKYGDGTIESQKCTIRRGENKSIEFEYVPKVVASAERPDASRPGVEAQPGPSSSSSLGSRPPSGAIALLGAQTLEGWVQLDGETPATWPYRDGILTVGHGQGSIMTRRDFGSHRLHVEFRIPRHPEGLGRLDRGNSGVYLLGRYELQILDTFGEPPSLAGCGAIYGQVMPSVNVCKPPGEWQTYDITFHAPRFAEGQAIERARISVVQNGTPIIDNREVLPCPEGVDEREVARGPVFLQEHGDEVQFRNLWIEPLDAEGGSTRAERARAWESAGFQKWMKEVAALSGQQQVYALIAKLRELNPDFLSEIEPTIEGEAVVGLAFSSEDIADISPVRAFRRLKSLRCPAHYRGKRLLTDLSPLVGLPIEELDIGNTGVSSLAALRGMKLRVLNIESTPVDELSPLKGLPIENLNCKDTPVENLSGIEGMPLRILNILYTKVSDLAPLKGRPINFLQFSGEISNLTPLAGMKLKALRCEHSQVSDFSALASSGIENLEVLSDKDLDFAQFTRCTKLTHLDIRSTRATDADVAALRKALPGCNIESNYP